MWKSWYRGRYAPVDDGGANTEPIFRRSRRPPQLRCTTSSGAKFWIKRSQSKPSTKSGVREAVTGTLFKHIEMTPAWHGSIRSPEGWEASVQSPELITQSKQRSWSLTIKSSRYGHIAEGSRGGHAWWRRKQRFACASEIKTWQLISETRSDILRTSMDISPNTKLKWLITKIELGEYLYLLWMKQASTQALTPVRRMNKYVHTRITHLCLSSLTFQFISGMTNVVWQKVVCTCSKNQPEIHLLLGSQT